ncbi:hypothetical protein AB0H43_32000 [Hamadaea sp. NPDC050747]|uniref:hypothetical protein n=1 Tax=Hamadaea sp. NPDC050747 TaxID=3155789 RepID=UPI0033DDE47D
MTVTDRIRHGQIVGEPTRLRPTISTRRLTISLASATVAAWAWHRTGDPVLTGVIASLATAAFNHYVAD